MLVASIFSLSHNVFKRLLSQGCWNSGLCGKEYLQASKCIWCNACDLVIRRKCQWPAYFPFSTCLKSQFLSYIKTKGLFGIGIRLSQILPGLKVGVWPCILVSPSVQVLQKFLLYQMMRYWNQHGYWCTIVLNFIKTGPHIKVYGCGKPIVESEDNLTNPAKLSMNFASLFPTQSWLFTTLKKSFWKHCGKRRKCW